MKLNVACIQLTSGDDIAANVMRIESLVAEAKKKGAEFVALPENAFCMDPSSPSGLRRTRKLYTQVEHPGVAASSRMAEAHGVWLLAGSVAVKIDESRKTLNRSLLFNPKGEIVAHYDKIHLFDVEVGDGQSYRESAKMMAGERAVTATIFPSPLAGEGGAKRRVGGIVQNLEPTPHDSLRSSAPPQGGSVKIGLTICYDVRFPQLYRALAKQSAEIIAVPSAFTAVTGEAHWHVLLRARAIENGCFIIAPAQTGTHPGGRKTFGHSLIVDPWGKILADGGTEESVVMAEIDLAEVRRVRTKIPSLEHDRTFQ